MTKMQCPHCRYDLSISESRCPTCNWQAERPLIFNARWLEAISVLQNSHGRLKASIWNRLIEEWLSKSPQCWGCGLEVLNPFSVCEDIKCPYAVALMPLLDKEYEDFYERTGLAPGPERYAWQACLRSQKDYDGAINIRRTPKIVFDDASRHPGSLETDVLAQWMKLSPLIPKPCEREWRHASPQRRESGRYGGGTAHEELHSPLNDSGARAVPQQPRAYGDPGFCRRDVFLNFPSPLPGDWMADIDYYAGDSRRRSSLDGSLGYLSPPLRDELSSTDSSRVDADIRASCRRYHAGAYPLHVSELTESRDSGRRRQRDPNPSTTRPTRSGNGAEDLRDTKSGSSRRSSSNQRDQSSPRRTGPFASRPYIGRYLIEKPSTSRDTASPGNHLQLRSQLQQSTLRRKKGVVWADEVGGALEH